jgi:hypothetical protein
VLKQLRGGICVPVLGSGLLEPLVGSTREIAHRLAGNEPIPLAPRSHDDLPQVAQYLSTMHEGWALRQLVIDDLKDELCERLSVPAPPAPSPGPGSLAESARQVLGLLGIAAARRRIDRPAEPHTVLARLNCPLYITTNPDDLLTQALRAAGKTPTEQRCNWLTPPDKPTGSPPDGPVPPSVEKPLVYQLFGHLSEPTSVVLSEDDYFKFLIGMSLENARPAGSFVNEILTQAALLFLGFHLDDWDFRAFLKFFLSREAAKVRESYEVLDVAVQLDPDDGRNAEPARVREYLERLFQRAKITIYWGSVEQFLEELNSKWTANP